MKPLTLEKARGAFFTPPEIASFLCRWAIRSAEDLVLEPSCGDAAFLEPAARRLLGLGTPRARLKDQLRGVDLHEPSCLNAANRLRQHRLSATISSADFFAVAPDHSHDAVVGNPPYIRYQEFGGEARAASLRAALAHGVRLNRLASSWAAFTVHASEFLKPQGRLAFVLPAELLSVGYAAEVRRFLLRRFQSVRLILFEQLVFPGALEEVVLLLAEGSGGAESFEVYQATNAADLQNIVASRWTDFKPEADDKWTSALLPSAAIRSYRQLTRHGAFAPLVAWGGTYLGAVTGNNKFFSLTAHEAADLRLPQSNLLKISPPGSRHLRGLNFTDRAWQSLSKAGAKCYLFYPPTMKLSQAAKARIEEGEELGVNRTYKCRMRKPWWRVPLVDPPDLFFTYMNHDRPRLSENHANVHILNSLYGITLRPEWKKLGRELLPIACLNSLTLLGAEIVGRSYGGGLLKHEPREADRLPVPSPKLMGDCRDQLLLLRPQLAAALRRNDIERASELVDGILLRQKLELTDEEILAIRAARKILFERRIARGKTSHG